MTAGTVTRLAGIRRRAGGGWWQSLLWALGLLQRDRAVGRRERLERKAAVERALAQKGQQ